MENEMILCVKSKNVKFYKSFMPLKDDVAVNHHLFWLLDNAELRRRDSVEHDERYKQIIVYVIVKNKELVYRYVRSGGEDRLMELYSLGIGGHVNLDDMKSAEFDAFGAIECGLRRELGEELFIRGNHESKWVGVINDNSNQVGKVHLGIVMEIDVDGDPVYVVDNNLSHGVFEEVSVIKSVKDKYESWSQLLIMDYLEE